VIYAGIVSYAGRSISATRSLVFALGEDGLVALRAQRFEVRPGRLGLGVRELLREVRSMLHRDGEPGIGFDRGPGDSIALELRIGRTFIPWPTRTNGSAPACHGFATEAGFEPTIRGALGTGQKREKACFFGNSKWSG
jgi:hypothetical protein